MSIQDLAKITINGQRGSISREGVDFYINTAPTPFLGWIDPANADKIIIGADRAESWYPWLDTIYVEGTSLSLNKAAAETVAITANFFVYYAIDVSAGPPITATLSAAATIPADTDTLRHVVLGYAEWDTDHVAWYKQQHFGNMIVAPENVAEDLDEKVAISANDTTPDYLLNKIVESTYIDVAEVGDGGDEGLSIAVDLTEAASYDGGKNQVLGQESGTIKWLDTAACDEEAGILGPEDGGTGIDTSASTGVAIVDAGTWSIDAELDPDKGGTGIDTSGSTGYPHIAAGTWAVHKSNLAAAADPVAGDDTNDGYVVGSMWLNTTDDKAFICLDNTAAAAVWLETTYRMTQAFISLYRTAAFDMAANNTWYDLPFNIASPCKKNVTHDHTSNPEQITLTEGGTYEFKWDLNAYKAATVLLCNSRLLDDGTEIPGTYRVFQSGIALTSLYGGKWTAFVAANSVIELQVGTHIAGVDIDGANGNEPDPTTRVVAALTITKISDDTS